MIVYKIRNKKTGLFSKGGTMPTFEKIGKTWNTKGALNIHLSGVHHMWKYNAADVEIVPIEVIKTELEPIAFDEHEKERLAAKQKRAEQEKAKFERHQTEKRRQDFLKLQKEFDPK